MLRILAHLLLSVALIFQGMGAVACANGAMSAEMARPAQTTAMHDGTVVCMSAHACPGCPSKPMTAHDCQLNCSLPAGLPSVAFFVPHLIPGHAPTLPPQVSLVEYRQVPPTPPPIA